MYRQQQQNRGGYNPPQSHIGMGVNRGSDQAQRQNTFGAGARAQPGAGNAHYYDQPGDDDFEDDDFNDVDEHEQVDQGDDDGVEERVHQARNVGNPGLKQSNNPAAFQAKSSFGGASYLNTQNQSAYF